MELNQKQLLALVAIGAAFWYLTRKNPATAAQAAVTPAAQPAPAGGGIWDGFGVGGSLSQAMGQVAATAQPLPTPSQAAAPVATTNTKAPPQTAMPDSGGAVFGGTTGGSASSSTGAGYLDSNGVYHYADGSQAYTGGGTFGYLNNGKTNGQNAMAILGY